MRKIYTVVFALMVLLSVTMSAMAAEQAPELMPEYSKIAVVVIILEAPAPSEPAQSVEYFDGYL